MSRVQAPVRYTIQQSPTRAGVYKPPYTIINLSNDHTVWIADNAGLMVGQGTPLFPGTSITWTQDGELWCIAEHPDTDIVVSYDVADWQPNPVAIGVATATAILNSGVLVIDNPVTLLPGGQYSGSFTSEWFDITTYSSLELTVSRLGTNPSASVTMFIQYSMDGIGIIESRSYFSRDQYDTIVSAPAKYRYVRIVIAPLIEGGTFYLDLTASHRSVNGFSELPVSPTDYASSMFTPYLLFGGSLAPFYGTWEMSAQVRVVPTAGTISLPRFDRLIFTGGSWRVVNSVLPELAHGTGAVGAPSFYNYHSEFSTTGAQTTFMGYHTVPAGSTVELLAAQCVPKHNY